MPIANMSTMRPCRFKNEWKSILHTTRCFFTNEKFFSSAANYRPTTNTAQHPYDPLLRGGLRHLWRNVISSRSVACFQPAGRIFDPPVPLARANEKRTHLWQNRVQWEEPWRHRGMLLVHRMPPPLRPGSLCADTDFTLCSWVGRRNGPPVFGAQRGVCVCSRLLRVVTSHLPRASGTGDTGLERNQEVRVCFFFTRGGLKKNQT